MKILFLSPNCPVPANSGQAIRTLSIVQACAAYGDVSFLSFGPSQLPDDIELLSRFCKTIEVVTRKFAIVAEGSDARRRLACLLRMKSYGVERFRSPEMAAKIKGHLDSSKVDLVVADGVFVLANVPESRVPIVLNTHNLEHIILQRYAEFEKNTAKKLYASLEARLMRSAEFDAFRRSASILVCSDKERELLNRLQSRLSVHTVPNSVDTEYYSTVLPKEPTSGASLLFQGGMDWYPNRDAVEYFAEDILPLILKEHSDVRFVVAGRNPPAELIRKYSRNNVEFTGTVPDMRPYLSAATLAVVPLRIGSGTRLKILESGAANKAVVSTSVGAEGLDMKSGEELLIADTPKDFAAAVSSLLTNPSARARLAEKCRRRVVENYSQSAITKRVREVLDSVTGITQSRAGAD